MFNINDYILYVYKTTNTINGMIYVGQHIQDKSKKDKYKGSGTLLKENMVKYGHKYFKKEIVEYCNTLKELNDREIYWIKKLDSTNPVIGYNITGGGQQLIPTDRFKEIIRENMIKLKNDNGKYELWKKRISDTIKENGTSKGKNNPMYGVEFTEERKNKCKVSKVKNKDNHIYYTQEYRDECRNRNYGENNPNFNNRWSDEQKKSTSEYRKRNKIFAGENNPNYGKYGENASGYKKIDNDILVSIVTDYTQNFISIVKLVEKYGYCDYKIKNELLKRGIKITTNGLYVSEENINKIISMYNDEYLTCGQIAKRMGLKDGRFIKSVLLENNIILNDNRIYNDIQNFIDNNDDIKPKDIAMKFNLHLETVRKNIRKGKIIFHK